MSKISQIKTKKEREFLKRIKKHPKKVIMAHEDSVQEGFEYFESQYGSLPKDMLFSMGLINTLKIIKIMIKYMSSMIRERNKCFTDLEEYLDELDEKGKMPLSNEEKSLIKNYPNKKLWNELKEYAWEKWNVIIGFTELPRQLIFKDKAVLFKYALVCIQEMDKDKIDLAPKLDAGEEVQRVYNSLGIAVNDIANWLRKKFGIKCQSNHPLGGLVDTSPLAGKAGLGWQGHNGLLITAQFGPRNRIAPIFIKNKLFEFTDSHEHVWIEDFCEKCRRCEKSCPTQAIYSKKQPSIENIPGINQTRTCIDREKCYPQFSETLGCSICMKVCPFSQGDYIYYTIKENFLN